MLTDRAARGVGVGLGWLGYALDRRHRCVADDTLRHAFPELDAAGRDRLVRASFQHFAGLLIEIVRLQRKLHVGNWLKHVRLIGNRAVTALTGGRPVMLV